MLKLCGALCVLGACAAIGFGLQRRLHRRVCVLQSLVHAFSQLRTQIVFLQSPLPQAVNKVAMQTGDVVFTKMAQHLQAGQLPPAAMQAALAKENCLAQTDRSLLLRAAQPLGSSDTEAQSRHIESVTEQLSAQLTQARTAAQTNGRLYMAAGVLGGMLLVILLL